MAKKVIAVANQKGGVGKTTTVLNLAAHLAQMNKNVLCIDLDGQGNLSDYLGYEYDENAEDVVITDLLQAQINRTINNDLIEKAIKVGKNVPIEYIPADITLAAADMFLAGVTARELVLRKILAVSVFDKFDYILIDCLPSLGVLVQNALCASDGVIIPVQTQKFALNGIVQFEAIVEEMKELNPKLEIIGVVRTMVDNTNMTKAVNEALEVQYGDRVFETYISKSVTAANSTADQKEITASSKLGQQYAKLAEELVGRETAMA